MGYVKGRTDRTARLIKLQFILHQHPNGLNIKDMATKCSVCERTAYRDLKSLTSELGIPIWQDNGKYGIGEGYYLPPIHFTLMEASTIFLASRLIQKSFPSFHQGLTSAFLKLNTIVPPPLKQQIRKTIEHMEKQTVNQEKMKNFNALIQAWLSQHQVRIKYLDTVEEKLVETTIDPYFIEPSSYSRSSYVIGYCHTNKSICSIKISRILGDVTICPEKFATPLDFNALDYLDSAWGVNADKDLYIVKLLFSTRRKGVKETLWHPSQKVEVLGDGCMIMTLRVRITREFRTWILGWGGEVKVIEPEILRKQIIEDAQSILKVNSAQFE